MLEIILHAGGRQAEEVIVHPLREQRTENISKLHHKKRLPGRFKVRGNFKADWRQAGLRSTLRGLHPVRSCYSDFGRGFDPFARDQLQILDQIGFGAR